MFTRVFTRVFSALWRERTGALQTGIARDSVFAKVPDRRCTPSFCIASGKRRRAITSGGTDTVMAGLSRPKDGVASLAYVPAISIQRARRTHERDRRAFAAPKGLRPRRRDKSGDDAQGGGKRSAAAVQGGPQRLHGGACGTG